MHHENNHENNVPSLLSRQRLCYNLCTWAHDEQCRNRTSCAEGRICHIAIVVVGRAH